MLNFLNFPERTSQKSIYLVFRNLINELCNSEAKLFVQRSRKNHYQKKNNLDTENNLYKQFYHFLSSSHSRKPINKRTCLLISNISKANDVYVEISIRKSDFNIIYTQFEISIYNKAVSFVEWREICISLLTFDNVRCIFYHRIWTGKDKRLSWVVAGVIATANFEMHSLGRQGLVWLEADAASL